MSSSQSKQVRWLKAALDDVTEIVDYIARDNAQAAQRFAERLFDRVELLADSPELGSVCPYDSRARQLVHGNYIIYYTVHETRVVIRAVVHGARLFRSYWLDRHD